MLKKKGKKHLNKKITEGRPENYLHIRKKKKNGKKKL